MDALKDISDVEQAKNHEKLIEQLMEQTGEPTEEQKAEVQKYLDEVESVQARMKMEQVSQKEKLRQKLGARRKLREEVMVEEAVAEELDHITKKEVCDGEGEGVTHRVRENGVHQRIRKVGDLREQKQCRWLT